VAEKLNKQQQIDIMVKTANQEYPMKELYSKLKGAFSGQPFQAPQPMDMSKKAKEAELAAKMQVDDVRKSQADYGRAMDNSYCLSAKSIRRKSFLSISTMLSSSGPI